MNEFDLVLPATVDVREVGMRDGLQLEAPVPLAGKLAMLEALVATGVRRIEVTSFVSPKAGPALADADQLACVLVQEDTHGRIAERAPAIRRGYLARCVHSAPPAVLRRSAPAGPVGARSTWNPTSGQDCTGSTEEGP